MVSSLAVNVVWESFCVCVCAHVSDREREGQTDNNPEFVCMCVSVFIYVQFCTIVLMCFQTRRSERVSGTHCLLVYPPPRYSGGCLALHRPTWPPLLQGLAPPSSPLSAHSPRKLHTMLSIPLAPSIAELKDEGWGVGLGEGGVGGGLILECVLLDWPVSDMLFYDCVHVFKWLFVSMLSSLLFNLGLGSLHFTSHCFLFFY